MPRAIRMRLTRCGVRSAFASTSRPRSAAYDTRRRAPGFSGSIRPSPANASLSITLKLPPSSVRVLLFVSHNARSGRAEARVWFHSATFSAVISLCTIGTSADWFFWIVMRSFRRYRTDRQVPEPIPRRRRPRRPRPSARNSDSGWHFQRSRRATGAGVISLGAAATTVIASLTLADLQRSCPVRASGPRRSAGNLSMRGLEARPAGEDLVRSRERCRLIAIPPVLIGRGFVGFVVALDLHARRRAMPRRCRR